jgi:polyprenyl-phospho-N-acetylgalactosaminyl synthase
MKHEARSMKHCRRGAAARCFMFHASCFMLHMKIVVIIPAWNEEKMIAEVVAGVREVVPHVFVIDDGSSDATALEARRAGGEVFTHAINRGQGAALATGISAAVDAGADIIVTFDADGQMDPADIPRLISSVVSGEHDVVLGSRFLCRNEQCTMNNERVPILRRWTLKLALAFTRLTTGLKLTDTHNGLRAFSKNAALALDLECDRMAHASEILEKVAENGLRYAEVPVTLRYTEYSKKKGQKFSGAFKILRDLVISDWID